MSTITASLPASGPYVRRTTRPTSTNLEKTCSGEKGKGTGNGSDIHERGSLDSGSGREGRGAAISSISVTSTCEGQGDRNPVSAFHHMRGVRPTRWIFLPSTVLLTIAPPRRTQGNSCVLPTTASRTDPPATPSWTDSVYARPRVRPSSQRVRPHPIPQESPPRLLAEFRNAKERIRVRVPERPIRRFAQGARAARTGEAGVAVRLVGTGFVPATAVMGRRGSGEPPVGAAQGGSSHSTSSSRHYACVHVPPRPPLVGPPHPPPSPAESGSGFP
ncbi:hypothetical protein BDK51DRAFT_45893 [Blyttiomyces helicus]|uniref:Uncharacterized protein n=1 Tax=Blyttiomyces helicus TaxID=388810 RepID=A0A4P9VWT0_9FUNG|nr:hypothetical protein BDK51DRAFT_45893 [Blyttiomyces helicus]|eukprot:RKO84171.1 hypothetical protein BDK51DRAFT_45893 [Blyttiomyces helicus]